MEVFVVDNDETVLVFMRQLLENEGYSVTTAEDGLSALHVLASYTPDVAFIDLIMPKIDGRKLCQIMKTMPALKNTRLVMLSAVSKEERVRYTEMGFEACIAKGPLKKQGENVLRVIQLIENGDTGAMPDDVLGLENLYTREITKELLSSRRHHELIEENLTEGILELTVESSIIFANPAALRILDLPESRVLGLTFPSLLSIEQRGGPMRLLESIQINDRTAPAVVDVGKKKVEMSCLSIVEEESRTIIVILNDITKRLAAGEALQKAHDELEQRVEERTAELARVNLDIKTSLGEKEILLREVHHRVKNNLQIVSSLLSLQSANVTDDKTIQVFRESMNRINSIAMVHETIYQSQDLAGIDLGRYIKSVAEPLIKSYNSEEKQISLTVKAEPVYFDIDRAVPCGLIINELITNSLKHGFPGDRPGTIDVVVRTGGSSTCRLVVSDDGIGLPDGFREGKTLGMNIVQTLVRQLDGKMAVKSDNGVRIIFDFPIG